MIERIAISVLSENHQNKTRFINEHGLSLHIDIVDSNNHWTLIFDTGASNFFIYNAKQLGVEITNLDAVILSHGHYDHTGGLEYIKGKTIYAHPQLFQKKYKKQDSIYTYIGIPHPKSYYENTCQNKFIDITSPTEILPNVWTVVSFPAPVLSRYFYIKDNNNYTPDTFQDELMLVINMEQGLIIISGCAHCGIISMIEYIQAWMSNKPILGLFGGLHLYKENKDILLSIGSQISNYKIGHIGLAHCSGNQIKKYISGNVFDFNVGDKFVLDNKERGNT